MKDKIKKGQAFIGQDDSIYYFLGYSHDNQILFTTHELWCEKEPKFMEKTPLFIKKTLDEYSEIIKNCTWYYQSMEELLNSTTDEKVKRCLDIISNSNTKEITLKPIKILDLVSGQAFFEEENQYYEAIGFIVENELYVDGKKNGIQKGFFSIYHSNCNENAPLIFELPLDENNSKFASSNGSNIDIKEILISGSMINEEISRKQQDRLVKHSVNERV